MNDTVGWVQTRDFDGQKLQIFVREFGDTWGRSTSNEEISIVHRACIWMVACHACLVELLPTELEFWKMMPSFTVLPTRSGLVATSSMLMTIISLRDGWSLIISKSGINTTRRQRFRLRWRTILNSWSNAYDGPAATGAVISLVCSVKGTYGGQLIDGRWISGTSRGCLLNREQKPTLEHICGSSHHPFTLGFIRRFPATLPLFQNVGKLEWEFPEPRFRLAYGLDVYQQVYQADGPLYPIPCWFSSIAHLDCLWLSPRTNQGLRHVIIKRGTLLQWFSASRLASEDHSHQIPASALDCTTPQQVIVSFDDKSRSYLPIS